MNKRKSKRLTKRLRVTVTSDNRSFQSYTGNVSAGGVSVRTQRPLTNGKSVMIKIELPSGEILSICGKVSWDFTIPYHGFRRNGMGIQFMERSVKYDEFINNLYSEDSGVIDNPCGDKNRQEAHSCCSIND